MEPLPETAEALRRLALDGDGSLGIELHAMAARALDLVPDLVGVSVGLVEDDLTLTMVAGVSDPGQSTLAVGSSLSLPLVHEGGVVGSVDLYAASPDAFTLLHESVALVVGSDARLAVADADLLFRTRELALAAPDRLAELAEIDAAVGALAERYGITAAAARVRLAEEAADAGTSRVQAAGRVNDRRGVEPEPGGDKP